MALVGVGLGIGIGIGVALGLGLKGRDAEETRSGDCLES